MEPIRWGFARSLVTQAFITAENGFRYGYPVSCRMLQGNHGPNGLELNGMTQNWSPLCSPNEIKLKYCRSKVSTNVHDMIWLGRTTINQTKIDRTPIFSTNKWSFAISRCPFLCSFSGAHSASPGAGAAPAASRTFSGTSTAILGNAGLIHHG